MESHLASCKPTASGRTKLAGFTYLTVLFAIAIAGIGLSVTSEVWFKQAEREHKKQAGWIGAQYEDAIASYFYGSPSTSGFGAYPRSLDDLLEDKRFAPPRRHLRQSFQSSLPAGYHINLVRLSSDKFNGIEIINTEGGLVCSHFFLPANPKPTSHAGRSN